MPFLNLSGGSSGAMNYPQDEAIEGVCLTVVEEKNPVTSCKPGSDSGDATKLEKAFVDLQRHRAASIRNTTRPWQAGLS